MKFYFFYVWFQRDRISAKKVSLAAAVSEFLISSLATQVLSDQRPNLWPDTW